LKNNFFKNLNIFKFLKKLKLITDINNLNFLSILNLKSNFIAIKNNFFNKNINNSKINMILKLKKNLFKKSILLNRFFTAKNINLYYYLKSITLPVYKFNLLFGHIKFNLNYYNFWRVNRFNKDLHLLYLAITHKKTRKLNPKAFGLIFFNKFFLKENLLKNTNTKLKKKYIAFPAYKKLILYLYYSLNISDQLHTLNSIKYMKFLEHGYFLDVIEPKRINNPSDIITKKQLAFLDEDILTTILEILIVSKIQLNKYKYNNFANLKFSNYSELNSSYNMTLNNYFKFSQLNLINKNKKNDV
jgi:hypothetical protein